MRANNHYDLITGIEFMDDFDAECEEKDYQRWRWRWVKPWQHGNCEDPPNGEDNAE